jgi:hypothetical protein
MNKLKYFLLGMFTAKAGLELFDSFSSLILQKCEVEKGKMQVQIAKLRADYEKASQPQETTSNSIGFITEPTVEEDESEAEEDE